MKIVSGNSINVKFVDWYLFMTARLKYLGRNKDKYFIRYFGDEWRRFYDISWPEDADEYTVEVIDIWDMTRKRVIERTKGKTRSDMPVRDWLVVLSMRI